jgi:hypothetical protein
LSHQDGLPLQVICHGEPGKKEKKKKKEEKEPSVP